MDDVRDGSDGDAVIIALHPALVEPFKAWLAGRGLRLGLLPPGKWIEDDEAIWIASPLGP